MVDPGLILVWSESEPYSVTAALHVCDRAARVAAAGLWFVLQLWLLSCSLQLFRTRLCSAYFITIKQLSVKHQECVSEEEPSSSHDICSFPAVFWLPASVTL